MTVFKGYWKIIYNNRWMTLLYLGIFFFITAIFQIAGSKGDDMSYRAQSVKLAFLDGDGGELSGVLRHYLGRTHQVSLAKDDKAALQEDLFYRNIEYIVRVPKGFYKSCIEEGEPLLVTKVPGSYTAIYVDQQINSFLNSARVYQAAGFTEAETADALRDIPSADVKIQDDGKTAGGMTQYAYYFRYIPYLFLMVLCYSIGRVVSAFRKGDLTKRMRVSAVPVRRQNLEGILATAGMGLLLWGVAIAVALFVYRGSLVGSGRFFYYLVNSLAMLFNALAISWFVGSLVNGINALNGMTNVLCLGMSFLCGVFVPLEMLSRGVRKAAQFFPVYWYEKANGFLSEYGILTEKIRSEVIKAIGIQFLFAAALIGIVVALSKGRQTGR